MRQVAGGRVLAIALLLRVLACWAALAMLLAACPSAPPPHPKTAKHHPPPVAPPKIDVPLADITNQFVLDKAWDGKVDDCQRYGQVAMTIVADDLETMELYLRCAAAHKVLWQAEAWVRSAYAVRLSAPVVRYADGIGRLLRGDPGGARKIFEKLGGEAPVAWYQAAIAAQIDDDALAAERAINLYVKAIPADPAGRRLQAEIVCALDVARCAQITETIRSTDDDETAVARRLGAGIGTDSAVPRLTLERLAKDAASIAAPAFDDAYALAAMLREGGDPALFVRSPRSGRPEPGGSTDPVRDARPLARLPFVTRIEQALARNDAAAPQLFAQYLALFPTELATYRLAMRSDKLEQVVRKEMENQPSLRWRVVAASLLARNDEMCPLVSGFPWTDRGPVATSTRVRCEMANDPARGRKIADDRLHAPPFGLLDVRAAIDGEANQRDSASLVALARRVKLVAPQSMLVAEALWEAGESAPKKQAQTLLAESVAQSAYDPAYARRLLRRYVGAKDVDRAKLTIATALTEAPLDAYLCGVEGEILLGQGKSNDALAWLTKACTSARARHERDVLDDTLAMLPSAIAKAKDKGARDAAQRCVKGE